MSQSGKNRVKLLQMMSKMLILERLDIVTGNRWQHLPRRTQPNSNPKPNLNLNKKKRAKQKQKKKAEENLLAIPVFVDTAAK